MTARNPTNPTCHIGLTKLKHTTSRDCGRLAPIAVKRSRNTVKLGGFDDLPASRTYGGPLSPGLCTICRRTSPHQLAELLSSVSLVSPSNSMGDCSDRLVRFQKQPGHLLHS